MTIVNYLLNYFQDKAEYIFPREVLENALFFNTACAIGIYNIKAKRKTNDGYRYIIPSYYGITFGNSGIGKNYSRDLTRNFYKELFDRLVDKCNDYMIENYVDNGKLEPSYIKLSDYYIPITSTSEGIQKQAQTLYAFGKGSVNIVNDEIGNFIQKSENVFAKLKTAWDSGLAEGSVNASDGNMNYFTIENMQFNMLLFGSPAPFDLFPNKKELLLEAYLSGMARRCFIYHNDNYNKFENINKSFETMSQGDIETIKNYKKELYSFLRNTKEIIYPNLIRTKLIEYDMQRQKLNANKGILEELFSYKKIEKLLPILAVLDLSETINEEHLSYAIDFCERTDKTVYKSIEQKPVYIKIYEYIEKKNKYVTRTDIIKDVKEATQKILKDEMVLVEEYANIVGNTLIKREYSGITKYKIEKMSQTQIENNTIISINKNTDYYNPLGWEIKQGNFFNLYKIVSANIRYSAGTFLNGHIKDENYLMEQNLIILDIDGGMTIDEAKTLLSDFTYLIATTKSHQKEKNGVICDRFRIILPTVSIFHLEPEIYRKVYENVCEALKIYDYDTKCKNVSRWYYGVENCEYWYNRGELLDIRMFIPDAIERIEVEKNQQIDDTEVDLDFRLERTLTWFLSNTIVGNRNDMVFRLGMMLRDKLNIDNYEHYLVLFNSKLSEPLGEKELNNIIKSIKRR